MMHYATGQHSYQDCKAVCEKYARTGECQAFHYETTTKNCGVYVAPGADLSIAGFHASGTHVMPVATAGYSPAQKAAGLRAMCYLKSRRALALTVTPSGITR